MRDILIIFCILLGLLMCISALGGSIRTSEPEKYMNIDYNYETMPRYEAKKPVVQEECTGKNGICTEQFNQHQAPQTKTQPTQELQVSGFDEGDSFASFS